MDINTIGEKAQKKETEAEYYDSGFRIKFTNKSDVYGGANRNVLDHGCNYQNSHKLIKQQQNLLIGKDR